MNMTVSMVVVDTRLISMVMVMLVFITLVMWLPVSMEMDMVSMVMVSVSMMVNLDTVLKDSSVKDIMMVDTTH